MTEPHCRCGEIASVITPTVSAKAGRLLCGYCARLEAQPDDEHDYWVGLMGAYEEFRELTA